MKWPEKLSRMEAYKASSGDFPVRLDANESFLTPPSWLLEELRATASKVQLNRYPDPMALELCRVAARYYGVGSENIVAGNGSDELIALIMASFVPQGGRVLISRPDFSMYQFYAGLYEFICVPVGKEERRAEPEAFVRALRETSADLVIFSNPCNPTGLGITRDEVERVLQAADCLVVVDEAYMDFWDQSVRDKISQCENLLILKTASKAVGLAAIRLGFALGPPPLIQALQKTKSPFNVGALTQAVGATVYRHADYLRDCVLTIRASAKLLFDQLMAVTAGRNGVFVHATNTNFVLLETPEATRIYESLKAKGILIRQVAPELLRITAGSFEESARLLSALVEILS